MKTLNQEDVVYDRVSGLLYDTDRLFVTCSPTAALGERIKVFGETLLQISTIKDLRRNLLKNVKDGEPYPVSDEDALLIADMVQANIKQTFAAMNNGLDAVAAANSLGNLMLSFHRSCMLAAIDPKDLTAWTVSFPN